MSKGKPRQRWFDRVNKDMESQRTTRIENEDDRDRRRDLVKSPSRLVCKNKIYLIYTVPKIKIKTLRRKTK